MRIVDHIKLLCVSIFLLLISGYMAFADQDDAIPISIDKEKKPTFIKKHSYLYPGRNEIQPFGKDATDIEQCHSWLFNYNDENEEYYLSGGAAGDEWGIWFQAPHTALFCSLYAVEFMFYAPKGGDTILFNVMKTGNVSPDTVPNWDSIAVEDIFGENLMGEGEESPLDIQATSDWEKFKLYDLGYEIEVGTDIFWVHWTKTGDSPMILADGDNQGDYLHTWDYEPNQDGDEKWSHYGTSVGIEAMVRCEVVLDVSLVSCVKAIQMNDTYRTDAVTLTAIAHDCAANPALAVIDSGKLYYSLNSGDWVEVIATVTGNSDIGFTLCAEVPVGVPGDVYEYYFEAVNKVGKVYRSFPALSFKRVEPANPDADILIIADRESRYQANHDLYRRTADKHNLVYEFWNTKHRHGIDASVIGFGPSNIIVYGWGTTTVPCTTEFDPGYGAFLDNGGNLLLVDQDWFYGHGLPASPVFEAGDFAYDYFGIVGGTNNPNDGGSPPVPTADTVFYGQDVTAMDSPFTETLGGMTINHNIYGTTNWGDYFDASNATIIFKGAVDGNTYGSVKEGTNYKAVYLGIMMDAAVDTTAEGVVTYDAFSSFLGGVFDYFNVSSPPYIDDVSAFLTTATPGPYTVNAKIVDYNGDAITATLKWSVDGSTWNDVNMVDDGTGLFSGNIPDQAASTFIYYYIHVVDATNREATYPDANTSPLEFYFHKVENKVLYVTDGGYSASYFDYEDGVSVLHDRLDTYYNGGKTDGSIFTTANYDAIVWNADFGWESILTQSSATNELSAYINAGGKLFLSSDELMGNWSDWTNVSFTNGDFICDYFGVDSVIHDVGVDSLIAVAGDVVTDGLSFGTYSAWLYDFSDAVTYTGTAVCAIEDRTSGAMAIRNEFGNAKLVFNTFPVSYLDASEYTAYLNTVLTWFGIEVSVDESVVGLPEDFELSQNYPNPFNPTTNIDFTVPEVADVRIDVYNLLGQKVVELVNRAYQPGRYNIVWNGKDASGCDVSSGVYFYKMTAGDFTKTSKMIYLK